MPPTKLATGSTFHALSFNDVPGDWLQHQKSVLADLCICPTCDIHMVSVVSLPESRKLSECKAEKERDLAGAALVERKPQESQGRRITEWKRQGWIKQLLENMGS